MGLIDRGLVRLYQHLSWPTATFALGLLAILLGERALSHLDTTRLLLSGGGALVVLAMTAVRAAQFRRAEGASRSVERILLLCKVGCLLALALYLVSSDDGMRWLGIKIADATTRARYQGGLGVLWPIGLVCAVVPLLAAEWGVKVSSGGDLKNVESYRVAELATSGLTVALAGALLFVVCYIAADRDKKVDLSYFRTSSPGTATRNMVQSLDEPLKVMLFFPEVNEVKDEVRTYFDDLARGGHLDVEEHDRVLSPKLAEQYRATKDGTVVLVRGEQSETIPLGTDLAAAREQLRTLDENVQKTLMKVIRASRVAYLTVGHGELNDPESESALGAHRELDGSVVKQLLGALNYRVKELGLVEGLGRDVPEDASIVLVLGPRKPLSDEELDALDRYLERGGALLVALDPMGEAGLGKLEGRLGVHFDKTPLADDKEFFARSRQDADHRLIVTDKFSAHASVTMLSRAGVGTGILLVNSGSLSDAPFTVPGEGQPKRTYVVKSLPSTFSDSNDNFDFDQGEQRKSYNLVAAIEAAPPKKDPHAPPEPEPAPGEDTEKDKDKDKPGLDKKAKERGMRALVYPDSELFSDGVLLTFRLNGALVADAVKWLGGEESFSGETRSEKDVRIEHTRSQDVAWFYSTIIGAPVLVLCAGLLSVWRRRNRNMRRAP